MAHLAKLPEKKKKGTTGIAYFNKNMNQKGHAGWIQVSAQHKEVKPSAPVNPPVLQNKQESIKTEKHTS